MKPTVKLVACTPNPVETIFATEMFAKTRSNNEWLIDPFNIARARKVSPLQFELLLGIEQTCD